MSTLYCTAGRCRHGVPVLQLAVSTALVRPCWPGHDMPMPEQVLLCNGSSTHASQQQRSQHTTDSCSPAPETHAPFIYCCVTIGPLLRAKQAVADCCCLARRSSLTTRLVARCSSTWRCRHAVASLARFRTASIMTCMQHALFDPHLDQPWMHLDAQLMLPAIHQDRPMHVLLLCCFQLICSSHVKHAC